MESQKDPMKTQIGDSIINKDNILIHVLGDLDELNANLGLCFCYLNTIGSEQKDMKSSVQSQLNGIQENIKRISAYICDGKEAEGVENILTKSIQEIDIAMAKYKEQIAYVTTLVTQHINMISSYLNISRTVCRRAERKCVQLFKLKYQPGCIQILNYINKLSNFLFILVTFAELVF
jgi:cob(I)alamin adenosyltransferase